MQLWTRMCCLLTGLSSEVRVTWRVKRSQPAASEMDDGFFRLSSSDASFSSFSSPIIVDALLRFTTSVSACMAATATAMVGSSAMTRSNSSTTQVGLGEAGDSGLRPALMSASNSG